MKKFLLFLVFASIVHSGCNKKNDDQQAGNPDEDAKAVHNLVNTLSEIRSKYLEIAPQINGDPQLALMQTLDWTKQQEGVANTYQIDSTYLYIEMSSGQTSLFWINELDEEGYSKYRGSGAGQLSVFTPNLGCSNVMENKKALIYAPGNTEFKYERKSKVPDRLEKSKKLTKVDYLKDEQATISKIFTFSEYGLVLMETHGAMNAFMTGNSFFFDESEIPSDYVEFKDALIKQIGEEYFNQLISGGLIVDARVNYDPLDNNWWENSQEEFNTGSFRLWVTVKYIEENMPSLVNTIVVGNFCYGGMTTAAPEVGVPLAIGQAFMNKNPRTYYSYQKPNGFSNTVDNLESIQMEDSLTRGLLIDNDSTGIAHLKYDGTQFQTTRHGLYLVHMGQPNWCYEGCGEDLIDGRDQEVYKTVCISNQVWMAENLRFDSPGSKIPEGKDIKIHGRLYDYNTATSGGSVWEEGMPPIRGNCPENWHVPHRDDWKKLIEELGGEPGADWFVSNNALKQVTIKMLGPDPALYNYDFLNSDPDYNSSGFSSLSTGYGVIPDGQDYDYRSDEGRPYFWSSAPLAQELDGDGNPTGIYDTESRWGLRIIPGLNFALYGTHPTVAENYYPCRCVKDE